MKIDKDQIKSDLLDIIQEVHRYLDSKNYKHVVSDNGMFIQVKNEYVGAEIIDYNAYELHLIKHCAKKLGSDLKYSIIKDENGTRFAITTDAKYDVKQYTVRTNHDLEQYKDHDLLCIFLGDNIDHNSKIDNCICTMFSNGTWKKVEYSRPEVLFCAVNNFKPKRNDEYGYYEYPEMMYIRNTILDIMKED